MNILTKIFGLDESAIRDLVVLIHEGKIKPVSYPHTNKPEILKRFAFVQDYYNYLTR